jgi:hypothetical protein
MRKRLTDVAEMLKGVIRSWIGTRGMKLRAARELRNGSIVAAHPSVVYRLIPITCWTWQIRFDRRGHGLTSTVSRIRSASWRQANENPPRSA